MSGSSLTAELFTQSASPRRRWPWVAAFAFANLAFLAIAASTSPKPFALALLVVLMVLGAWFVKPIAALCATVFLALIADGTTAKWYPFVKGMSAEESILFISNSAIISPLEVVLAGGVLALICRWLALGTWELRAGRMPIAVGAFVGFMTLAIARGRLTGADMNIALFQFRPFVALLLIYILTSSVCRAPRDYQYLLGAVVAAIGVHALISWQHISQLSALARKNTESILDHGSAVRMNVLVIVVATSWLFRIGSRRMRWLCTVMLLPVAAVYGAAQRRAAVVALIVALGLLGLVVLWHRRRLFFKVVPIFALLLLAYCAAFWNSTSSAGFPAQAVKSVVSPSSVSDRNKSSDLYRIVENHDLAFTISVAKVQGIGLGNPFYRPYPLPQLVESFEYAIYIPHNSFLWVWMVSGFGGFVAMLVLMGRAISIGAAKIRSWAGGGELLVITAFTLWVVMFSVFTYVDIAWDAPNLVLLGAAVATCANFATGPDGPRRPIAAAAEAAPPRRDLAVTGTVT